MQTLSPEDLERHRADLAASFQRSAIGALAKKMEKALQTRKVPQVAVVGGVAANSALREATDRLGQRYNIPVYYPAPEYCTDNGAMIALIGQKYFSANDVSTYASEPFASLWVTEAGQEIIASDL